MQIFPKHEEQKKKKTEKNDKAAAEANMHNGRMLHSFQNYPVSQNEGYFYGLRTFYLNM